MTIRVALSVLAMIGSMLVPARLAAAQVNPPVPAPTQKVVLASGDSVTGVILAEDDEFITMQHPDLGVLKVPKIALAPPSAVIDVAVPEQTPPPSPWSGTFEAGVNGSTGNTDNQNIRGAFVAKHKTDTRVIDLGFTYQRATQDNEVTANNSLTEGRVTWPEADSPWGTFVGASVQTDKFRDFDYRVGVNAGRSYDFEDTKDTWLQGRFGLGLSKDYGGDDDGVRPEGVLGIDYWHNLSATTKVTAGGEIYPILNDLGQYRALARTAWQTQIADDSPWIFKIGLEMDYDSTAEGDVHKTDWDYFASLGYTF